MIWTVGLICMVLVGIFALVIGMLLDQPIYTVLGGVLVVAGVLLLYRLVRDLRSRKAVARHDAGRSGRSRPRRLRRATRPL